MSGVAGADGQGTSTRPYLLRALHDWCTDNGFTPYLAVHVDAQVQVPHEYVKNHEIVLNVSFDATSNLKLGNEFIEFNARFGGVPREIVVPVDHVVAIYARENGQGMAFPMPTAAGASPQAPAPGERALAGGPPVPGAPGAPRQGLRLASSDNEAATPDASSADGPVEPPPDQPPPGSRPALKRIK